MPNQLSVPSKKTYTLLIREAIVGHIADKHPETHPEAFRTDIDRWESLRTAAVSTKVHVDAVTALLQYHAQLVFILTKLPADIGLAVSFDPTFATSPNPVTLHNLQYERCATLFNLAAKYSQLAGVEDRSRPDGVKQANAYYQYAAGTFSYLIQSALPKLRPTVADDELPADLAEGFIKVLEWLMLAQAQECVWQRAVLDHHSNGVIAKLAAQVSTYYGLALTTVRGAPLDVRRFFPSGWLAHLETKQWHFDAASQYRKSVDDLEQNKYGNEIARLTAAQKTAKRGHDVARRAGSSIAPAILEDIKSLLEIVEKNLKRAERDNDLIYHQDVPAPSSLPGIQPSSVVRLAIPAALEDPKIAVGNEPVIFAELLSWGARTAIEIYEDRRATFVKEEVVELSHELDNKQAETLRVLNLPAAVEVLDKPIGLPPSLLSKAEEVRSGNGPEHIEQAIEDVQMLARRAQKILDDSLDVLDQEASEDEKHRHELPQRAPSHEANEELTRKAGRYRSILEQAAESDAVVRTRWEEWEEHITALTWDEATLEASVPSSTISPNSQSSVSGTTPAQAHARGLRVILEELDDLSRTRAQLVQRAKRRAEVDDIQPRIMRAATAFERWAEVHPSMFEDVLEEEIAKFEKFRDEIREGGQRQDELLETLKAGFRPHSTRMDAFLASRQEEPQVKEREHALQSLDLAYHKYKDILRHLDEGLQFYNDLSAILMHFQQTCKEWAALRRDELRCVPSFRPRCELRTPAPPRVLEAPQMRAGEAPQTPAARASRKIAMDLPPPDSDQWQTLDISATARAGRAGKGKKAYA
ncbi:BRO1-domain-containing protein [Vararia minispora EC-137]|uniref:BRO1-domain-containing protein n=1 Tax=Vararia minispora EC-137 TaxID=1314806 RepID=A0ACB8QRT2_9AGAM|nr:BRO1-domain-containing protein [Vararia minispora EC-137]